MENEAGTNQAGVNWIPLFGEFATSDTEVVFHGKRVPNANQDAATVSDEKDQPGFGLALSSYSLADGKVSADIEFERIIPESTCELAVCYDPNAEHFISAGLGSQVWAMFGIREWKQQRNGGPGWFDCQIGGDRANLKAGRSYHLEAEFRGSGVSVSVDGITVATAQVTSPLGRNRQVGLFCKGDHVIRIRNFTVESTKPRAFVVMQFGAEFDDLYHDVVEEICGKFEVNVLRADQISGPGLIIGDIIREIGEAQLIIADVTPPNPNVYFEIGYALALRKPTILLARKGTPLPFDVAGFRVLFYEDTIGGKKRLEEGLRRNLDAIIRL